MNVLVACEESQRVCEAFRLRGYNAFSCDLIDTSGEHPEWHFKMDCRTVIRDCGGILQTGETVYVDKWDMLIGFPPCTYICSSGNRWLYHPDDKGLPVEKRRPHPAYPDRAQKRKEGAEFFMELANAPIEYIAIENPIGVMSTLYRKPDQKVQPWWFGDSAEKPTCLWLKNLPLLVADNIVDKGERVYSESGRSMPAWYNKYHTYERSKTFRGVARAMAEQWGEYVDDRIHSDDK